MNMDSITNSIKKMFVNFFKKRITANLIIGGVLLTSFVLIGIFAPYVAPYDPEEMYYDHLKEGPSTSFFFGTDRFGRDVLSRVIVGTRTTLFMASVSTILAVGNVIREAVPIDGKPAARKMVSLSVAVDRRVINGDYAAQFLSLIKELLQNPQKLI